MPLDPTSEADTGLVLRVDAKVCHVEVASGETFRLPLAGKLFEGRSHEKRPVAVGDRVRLSGNAEDGFGAIEEVLPRTSKLGRRGAGDDEREQVLAANISLVLIVAPVREPAFQPALVDRILAATEREELQTAIVLSKIDRDKRGETAMWRDLYEKVGYRVFCTSIAEGHETTETLAEVHELLRNNVSVLAGLSGAGKSSLLNALMPGLDLRVGSLGRVKQGKHTTTHTKLIPLPGGGHVLDTPGVRNFQLFSTDAAELTFYFRELRDLVGKCSYRNCRHKNEPDCAVTHAVQEGEISESRYESFRNLYDELDES